MATMGPRIGRNELCACGSGKKFKRCCGAVDVAAEDPASRFFGVAAVLAGLMLVVAVVVTAREMLAGGEQQARKVWSEEHGHYHTVGGTSAEGGPGKVWSEEHGHWHEANSGGQHVVLDAESPNAGALEGLRAAELDKAREKVAPEGE